jgi:hypothetical protein
MVTTAKSFDYAQVKKFFQRKDGSIAAHVRVAVANRDMLYRDLTGGVIKQRVSREDLFDNASVDSLKLLTVTNGHTKDEIPNPRNYKDVSVGTTGEFTTAGLDGDYFGVTIRISRDDAIKDFLDGRRQFSPGYHRDLYEQDGHIFQKRYDYFELAMVDRARGGWDVRAKDSDDLNALYFDPSQIDDDFIAAWSRDSPDDAGAIDRLLQAGELHPRAVILNSNTPQQTMIDFTIGGKKLSISPESAQDAAALAAEFDAAKAVKDQLAAASRDSAQAEAELVFAKAKITELQEAAVRDAADQGAKVEAAIAQLAKDSAALQSFKAWGKYNTDAAEQALARHDHSGYMAAIVGSLRPDAAKDAASIAIGYQFLEEVALRDYPANKDMNTLAGGMGIPGAQARNNLQAPALSQWANVLTAGQGSYEGLINGDGGYPEYLPTLTADLPGVRIL